MRKPKNKKRLSQEEEDEIVRSMGQRNKPNEFNLNNLNVNFKCKTENQKKFVSLIKEKEIIIGAGFSGCGKAQPLDSIVYTPKGPVFMGSLKVGDLVNGINGSVTKVIGVFPQGKKDIYTVVFNDGSEVKCCLEHLWTVKKKHGNCDWETKSLQELKNDLSLGQEYKIPNQREVYFHKNTLPLDPYLLGILLAEGHLNKSGTIVFSSTDSFIINKVTSLLPKDLELNIVNEYDYRIRNAKKIAPSSKECYDKQTGETYTSITECARKKNLTTCQVRTLIKNKQILVKDKYIPFMKQQLKDLQLLGTCSYDKFIPDIYKYSSAEDRFKIIQGLFDGDAYVTKEGTIIYSTSSEKLKNDVVEIIQSLGGRCTVRKTYPRYRYKGEVKVSKHLHYEVSVTIHSPEKLLSLPRKVIRLENRIRKVKYISRIIKEIKFCETAEAQCIMVEAEDSLYLTNYFIATHNTFLAAAQALKLLKSEPHFKKIMLVKSVTDLKGEEVGFLKGELKDKMQPYMESFKDNFTKLIGPAFANKLQELGLIEVQPLAFIRGRSIDNTIIIVDEAQNLSYDVMKAVLTRIGENSKIIITGDVKQIDLKQKKESCLLWLTEKFEGNSHFGVVKFERTDQVRNPIINLIEDMFDELDNK